MVRGQSDPPDRVDGAGLGQHPPAGAQQVLAQLGVLPELGPVALDDDLDAATRPFRGDEAGDLPAARLRRRRIGVGQDRRRRRGVTAAGGCLTRRARRGGMDP